MKLIYQHSPALPMTSVSIILPRTGVCLDPADFKGLSRMMTRMMFMGAGELDNREFNSRLERMGASAGCVLFNDHFNFRLVTLTDNLSPALELFKLALTQPIFEQAEFDQLQAELVSGWITDREESKQLRAHEMYISQLFRGAPNGYFSDGSEEGLRACTQGGVRERFKQLYNGGEHILAVLSDLSLAEVESKFLNKLELEQVQNGNAYPWDDFQPETEPGRKVVIIPDPGTNTDEIICGAFSAGEEDEEWQIHRLISFIFGGDMNSRLFRVIRGDRGLSYGASCWYESSAARTPRNQISPFSMYTFPAAEHTAEALPLLISLYEELVEKGVDEEELNFAKKALINSHPFVRDSPQKLLSIKVGEALYGLKTDDEETNRKKIEGVTIDDVARVLRKTHHPDRLRIVLLGDVKRLEPLAKAIPQVEQLEVIPYPASISEGPKAEG